MTIRKFAAAGAVALAAVGSFAGCASPTSPPASGQLGQDQATLAACSGEQLATMVTIDVSGSGRSQSIADARLKVVSAEVRRTAICGGHLLVTAFDGTSAVTQPLFDGELHAPGATAIARLRRVPAMVNATMATITKGYQAVLSGPSMSDGSDITGQYRLAGEYEAQLGKSYTLNFVLLTDGFQTTGADAITHKLTGDDAQDLAEKVDLPTLKGATITVVGLGDVTGNPPSSDIVQGLVQFYNAICGRTHAAKCVSVTDFTVGR